MKRFFVFLGVVFTTIGSAVRAQEVDSMAPLQMSSWGDAKTTELIDYMPDITLDTRFGYNHDFTGGSGRIFGDGLYLDINGYISPHFSYSFNHRIASTYYEDNSGFNGTNWLTLTYEVGDFSFTAGKDALLVGSFEYDAYDLDSYYEMNSMFYNMLDCWQWGVSAAWYPGECHSIILQAAHSPFRYEEEDNLFSYAAGWRCESEYFESYWTANMWEYERGRYLKALNISNRINLGCFSCDLEYMTRAADLNYFFANDFTAIIAPSVNISDWVRIFAKCGYERVREEVMFEDFGTNLFYGGGVEFFPLREDKDIRVHAAWTSNEFFGDILNVGLTWKLNLTSTAKHALAAIAR